MSSFGLYRCFEQDCDCSTFEPVAPDSTNKPGEPTGGDSVALTAT